MKNQMTLTALPGLPIIEPGNDLVTMIMEALGRVDLSLQEGDILVIGQKVVSKAEGRIVDLREIQPSAPAVRLAQVSGKDPREVEILLRESRKVLRVRQGLIIVEHRLGFVCANAGLDHSNIKGKDGDPRDWVLKLPLDPDASAEEIRRKLERKTGVSIGVLIIDSHGRAWRLGTVGIAIGLAGLPGLVDLRGRPDLYGEPLLITQVGLADELAAAASILMGQADEGLPVVHVRGLPYPLREGSLKELLRPEEEDLFR